MRSLVHVFNIWADSFVTVCHFGKTAREMESNATPNRDFPISRLGTDKTGSDWLVEVCNYGPSDPWVMFAAWPADLPTSRRDYPMVVVNVWIESGVAAKIGDIEVRDPSLENRGIGSLILDFLIRWLRQIGIVRLYGDVSSMDSDHLDKLKHFYEKHGFYFELYPPGDPRLAKDPMTVGRVERQL